MTTRSFVVATAVVLSATLVNPSDSAAQRQRWPGGNGGGRQQEGGGGGGGRERPRDNGGAPRQNGGGAPRENGGSPRENGGGPGRENGGGRRRDDGGTRPQGGGGQAQVRSAQPRADQGDPGDSAPSTALRAGRREIPADAQIIAPPPQQAQPTPTPAPQTRSNAGVVNDGRVVRRRYPTEADRAGVTGGRADVNGGSAIADSNSRAIVRRPGNSGGDVRANTYSTVRGGSRVAVPRVGPPPGYYHDKGYYDTRYYSRGYYAYRHHSHGNVYVVPYGFTYYSYPGYYYNPYAFGYGPAGYGHVYFNYNYNSYIWHPNSVYRDDTYGNYSYPYGELRLKVEPRDAQVYIDGYYAGRVDDFDGIFQSLKLEEGEYQIEIVLPGFEPLAFNVRIFPGQKTTYEGDLIREP